VSIGNTLDLTRALVREPGVRTRICVGRRERANPLGRCCGHWCRWTGAPIAGTLIGLSPARPMRWSRLPAGASAFSVPPVSGPRHLQLGRLPGGSGQARSDRSTPRIGTIPRLPARLIAGLAGYEPSGAGDAEYNGRWRSPTGCRTTAPSRRDAQGRRCRLWTVPGMINPCGHSAGGHRSPLPARDMRPVIFVFI
jgi:hypothetical protein